MAIPIENETVTNVEILLCPDRDSDGFDQSVDFDDTDPEIAEERRWHENLDGDDFGNPDNSVVSCAQLLNTVPDNTDFLDGNAIAHPVSRFSGFSLSR
jgi:hypothetical protein